MSPRIVKNAGGGFERGRVGRDLAEVVEERLVLRQVGVGRDHERDRPAVRRRQPAQPEVDLGARPVGPDVRPHRPGHEAVGHPDPRDALRARREVERELALRVGDDELLDAERHHRAGDARLAGVRPAVVVEVVEHQPVHRRRGRERRAEGQRGERGDQSGERPGHTCIIVAM